MLNEYIQGTLPTHHYLSRCTLYTSVSPQLLYRKDLEKKTIMGKHKQVTCQICFKFMRSDNLKRHRKVHLKYSIESSLSTEDMCRDLVLEIVDKVVAPVEESSGIKRKHEVVEREAQITIDEEALKKSALKINKDLTVLLNILSKNFTK